MNIGFVICSRLHSSRVHRKAFTRYCGKSQIEHLIERLLPTEIPVHLAVPEDEVNCYRFLLDKYPKRVNLHFGFPDDPLKRMNGVAKAAKLDAVIRVSHDKIFLQDSTILDAVACFQEHKVDYLYSSHFTPGTGFEIISASSLMLASQTFNRVEHVSYAIKAVTKNVINWNGNFRRRPDIRLLVDYPEDVELMNVIFGVLGPKCDQREVFDFLIANPILSQINKMPKVTVYTCAYNADKWLNEAMVSVHEQFGQHLEYILVDDYSSDRTALSMAKFCLFNKHWAKWYRNPMNIGLASSSNFALKKARGEFIIRLDADDFFAGPGVVNNMANLLADRPTVDAVIPDFYLGTDMGAKVQRGQDHQHIGGTMFRTSAVNHVKFTEGLRNWDGLDFFRRAKGQINTINLNVPMFFYRQHEASMSKTNLEEREKTKREIECASSTP